MLACFICYAGIFNLTVIVNVMGSCFDEAYTRFLTKEEHEFKKQFVKQLGESARPSIQKSWKNHSPVNSKELLLEVSKLNRDFSEIISRSETFRYDTSILSQMKKVVDLLSIVICNNALGTSKNITIENEL